MSDDAAQQIDAMLTQIRGLIEKGNITQAHRSCEEVLHLDPNHQFALKLKAELEKSGKIMKVGAGPKKLDITALKCSSCGSPLNVRMKESETATCGICGAVLDISGETLEQLGAVEPSRFKPQSFLRLGKTCEYQGKKFQIIGRICKESRIEEWDPEDRCYYPETWNFDVWILVGENKEYIYICEDKEGYSVSLPFTPTNPNIPNESVDMMTLMKDHTPQRIKERGRARVVYFEGEFTWLPRVNDATKYCEYAYGIETYSVEARVKAGDTSPAEVEFFRTLPLDRLELAVMFGEESIIAEEEVHKAEEESNRKWAKAFFVVGGLSLLLFLVSLGQSGTKIESFQTSIDVIPEEGLVRGPFTLKKKSSVHKIVLKTSIPDNTYAWGGIELLDAEQAAINVVEGDFWRESGTDSDGRWSEQDTEQTEYFRLDTPGKYYVRLFGEKGTSVNGTLALSIYEGLSLSRYYSLAMLLCFGFGFAIRKYKTLNPFYVIVGIFALGLLILSMMGDDD